MSLQEKGNQLRNNDLTHSAPVDSNASNLTDPASEPSTVADESKDRQTDIIYPSGLKLALIMTSIFVSMFLVSLVRLIFF